MKYKQSLKLCLATVAKLSCVGFFFFFWGGGGGGGGGRVEGGGGVRVDVN